MIEFPYGSFDLSGEYREFILSHPNAVKTERSAWVDEAKAGKKIVPYCESWPQDEPERDEQVYCEFVDEDCNVYVDFFDRETGEWIDSYRFKDPKLSWSIMWDFAAGEQYRVMQNYMEGARPS